MNAEDMKTERRQASDFPPFIVTSDGIRCGEHPDAMGLETVAALLTEQRRANIELFDKVERLEALTDDQMVALLAARQEARVEGVEVAVKIVEEWPEVLDSGIVEAIRAAAKERSDEKR